MTNIKKLKKITTKKQLVKTMVIYGNRHEDFVSALREDITKLGEKAGREYYLFNDYWRFGVFSCKEDFKNIRFLTKTRKITKEEKEKIIKGNIGLYVYGSSHYRDDGKVTSQYITVVKNVIVVYWKDEDGEIYDIEAV
mgnify:CR=1 FL=1